MSAQKPCLCPVQWDHLDSLAWLDRMNGCQFTQFTLKNHPIFPNIFSIKETSVDKRPPTVTKDNAQHNAFFN